MKTQRLLTLIFLSLISIYSTSYGQGSANYQGGLKVSLNEDGSKYFRLLTWHQMWVTTPLEEGNELKTNFTLRRSRVLMYAQISDRFLINTHFGLNSLEPGNMGTASPISQPGTNGQLFMHGAWAQYTIFKQKLVVGGGLHYWNGISRLASQSTLNIMTLDAPIHNWATIGVTDQFARHLGFFAKGKLGKLDYRLAINEAISNPTRGADSHLSEIGGQSLLIPHRAIYRNPDNPGGGKVYQGYLNYQFLDQEGNLLPYFVGSYLGTKKVFNIGAGFFHHREGASYCDEAGNLILHSPTSLAVDVFYDSPLGSNGSALTFYGSWTRHDWGPDWTGGVGGVGTGNIAYGQLGYVLPDFTEKGRLQPYVHGTFRALEAYEDYFNPYSHNLGVGANWFIDGHNAKITLEYQRAVEAGDLAKPEATSWLRLQAMIYL
ncbi:MAG: porin [Bacteroidetes bacterium]|nr:porin [Bacteroidota bacterium]